MTRLANLPKLAMLGLGDNRVIHMTEGMHRDWIPHAVAVVVAIAAGVGFWFFGMWLGG
jgi:hypothetical protein